MLNNKKNYLINLTITGCLLGAFIFNAQAGIPLWSMTPLTTTTLTIDTDDTATVQYQITNNSSRAHTLKLKPITGVTQTTSGIGVCSDPFVLAGKSSCTLTLEINGSDLNNTIVGGPVLCQHPSNTYCYQPSVANILRITPRPLITVSNSPLALNVSGTSGQLTINNTSTNITALNITSSFNGTNLDGLVTETANTCDNLTPSSSCTITYTPGNTAVAQTNFTIQGTNTNTLTAAIAIQAEITISDITPSSGPAVGGTGVTITGTGFTGTSDITFDGISATSINVVNSTTVTAVTPAHAAGAVDVEVITANNWVTLSNGFTYIATSVGQSSGGGTIACLDGDSLDLIATSSDNSSSIEWGGLGVITNAQSDADGETNTTTIVACLANNGGTPYAAQLCNNYEVDSQGNTPCESGNTCYNDWFLPSKSQLNCLYTNRVTIGGFTSNGYLSSTEYVSSSNNSCWAQDFNSGVQTTILKNLNYRARCVRNL